MNTVRFWVFDQIVKLVLRTKWGKYLHNAAWHDGWEQRAMIAGPSCPSNYYPGPKLSDGWL